MNDNTGMSAADVLALTRGNGDGLFGGNGILALIVYKKIKYIQKIVIKTPIKLDSQ